MAQVKCVIWDMDNTLWNGICLEDERVELRPGIMDVLRELHARGLVQSVATKNEPAALDFLERFGLNEFFVYPHANWEPKEANIQSIVERLNIGMDAVAFVDDNPFERDSVAAMLPGIRTYDAADYADLAARPEFQLSHDTEESRARGDMYVEESRRKEVETTFTGSREDFLKSLEMVSAARLAEEADLVRISELVSRTNQFNSTGVRYTDEEISGFFRNDRYRIFVISLEDRYGDYGRCGVALVAQEEKVWTIELLLLSCRVAGRGLGTAFLSFLTETAKRSGAEILRAQYRKTDRNRQMGLLLKIVGFRRNPSLSDENSSVFEFDLSKGTAPCPSWVKLEEQQFEV